MKELDAAAGVLEEENLGGVGGLGSQQERVAAVPTQVAGPGRTVEKLNLDQLAYPSGKALLGEGPALCRLHGRQHTALGLGPDQAHGENLGSESGATKGGEFPFVCYSPAAIREFQLSLKGFPACDKGNLVPAGGLQPDGLAFTGL